MLRIIAALMFTLAGAFAGGAFSLRLRERREICRCIALLLDEAAVGIRCRGADVYELSRSFRSSPGLSGLSFLEWLPERFEPGREFRTQWQEALSRQELPDEEMQLLAEFGDSFGRSDAEGQLTVIEGLRERLGRITISREEAYAQKGRMYRSVGVLFGVMAGILVV